MKRTYLPLYALIILIFLSSCRMVSWDIPIETNGSYEVDDSGGKILFQDPSLISILSIEVPENAYETPVDFTISVEPFEPLEVPDMFNPITPLIVVDNGHIFSDQTLEVSIPIDIDPTVEFAMAFFYDDVTDSYEAIPTKSMSDNELIIFTHHFSKIVVSSILYETIRQDIIANPWFYDSGFTPGVDDWPFNNYGSEIEPEGHCAGQVLSMMWYYTEKKIKEQEPSLNTAFDNDTPDFWYDDVNAYRFASVIQNRIKFASEERNFYFQTLKQPDIERFYSFAYAIKITKRPQYIGIYHLNSKNKIDSGHAMSVYKIEYYINEFQLYVADPNFSGDDQRFISFSLDTGFGVYGSGDNAQDLTEDNLTIYTEFAYYAESAIIDYSIIKAEYQNMLNGTIGNDKFTRYTYEYLTSHVDGIPVWAPLSDELTYQDIQSATFAANEIVIRTTASNKETAMTYFQEYQSLAEPIMVNQNGIDINVIPLNDGENILGIYSQNIYELVIDNETYYPLKYSNYKEIKITYAKKTIEELEADLVGQYYEIERGSQTTTPEYEINLLSNEVFYMIEREYIANHKSGDWYIPYNSDGSILKLYSAGYGVDDTYIIDPIDDTITITRGENDYIIYQKQATITDVFDIRYETSFLEPNFLTSPITSTIYLDHDWAVAMNQPDGLSHEIRFYFHSNFFIRIRVTDANTSEVLFMTFSETPVFIHQHFFYKIYDDESASFKFEILAYNNGEWEVVYITFVDVYADFTKYN